MYGVVEDLRVVTENCVSAIMRAISMEPTEYSFERKQEFSRIFGHFFRTPLAYEQGRNRPDIVGQIFQAVSCLGTNPISFVYYWGVGTKSRPGRPEDEFVNYLDRFTKEFCDYFGKQPHFELCVLTDTHAAVNRVEQDLSTSYFQQVRDRYMSYCRSFEFASELWRSNGKNFQREDLLANGLGASLWRSLDFSQLLEEMAFRHFNGSPEEVSSAAKRYYRYNLVERQLVETQYPDHFFISWNSPILDPLFPSALPILHLHIDNRESDSDKPWFASND
jgi:hypothetical protein